MTTIKIFAILAFCLCLCALLLFSDRPAQAQSVEKDQEIAQRRGISESLASGKKDDDKKGVTKMQATLGIASVLIMLAVVKFW